MRVEFLMCGNPNDAFWSQAAIFRCSLDFLGGIYKSARLVLCLGSDDAPLPVPPRWAPWFSGIEVHWADPQTFATLGDAAQGHALFRLTDPNADLSIICDADSLLVRPLPDDFLAQFATDPAICGVIAHYPPPRVPYPGMPAPSASTPEELWQLMAEKILGRPIDLQTRYTLPCDGGLCPSFYINHAFLAGSPAQLSELHRLQEEVRPIVRSVLDNDFYDQISVTFAIEKGRLPHRQLPMRFNFPNDPIADQCYPNEMEQVVLLHYLRTNIFNRHQIFADPTAFDEFMKMQLTGSNAVLHSHISQMTRSSYPFLSL